MIKRIITLISLCFFSFMCMSSYYLLTASTEKIIGRYLYGEEPISDAILYKYLSLLSYEDLKNRSEYKQYSLLRITIMLRNLDDSKNHSKIFKLIELLNKKGEVNSKITFDGCNYLDFLIMSGDIEIAYFLSGLEAKYPYNKNKCEKDLLDLLNDYKFRYKNEDDFLKMQSLITPNLD